MTLKYLSVLVCAMVLVSCKLSKQEIYSIDNTLRKAEKERMRCLKSGYLSNIIMNSSVPWENKKAQDSIYVANRPVLQQYNNVLLKYSFGINSYPRYFTIDSIIAVSNLGKSDTLYILERISDVYPNTKPKIAYWKNAKSIFYVNKPKNKTDNSIRNFCSGFHFIPEERGKTREADSFDLWIAEMSRNPLKPVWEHNEIYIFTSIQKQDSSLKVLTSIIFIN
ncbi:MAG: hypothetical protein ACJAWV_000137 [Flammeovirgaceae bacterium]|jgi:hypothetical protein